VCHIQPIRIKYPNDGLTGSWIRMKLQVQVVEQELLTLPEHLSSSPVFSGVRATRSLVLCVCFVDRFLSFFFWPLCCLFFDLWIVITPLVSSNSSYESFILGSHTHHSAKCNSYPLLRPPLMHWKSKVVLWGGGLFWGRQFVVFYYLSSSEIGSGVSW
jgi:hypothetical protein